MKQVTSARGQNTRMGGSDPTLCGFQPPKTFVGSLPPAPSRSGPCFVRVQRSEQTACNASRITPQKRKGGKQLPLLKAPPSNQRLQPFRFAWRKKSDTTWTDTLSSSAQMRPTSSVKRSSSCSSGMTSSSAGWANIRPTSTSEQIRGDVLTKTA